MSDKRKLRVFHFEDDPSDASQIKFIIHKLAWQKLIKASDQFLKINHVTK